MTKNQIWGLALGAVAAAGVAFFVLTKVGHCSGSECQITVKVIDCPAGKLDVTPDPARISVAKHIKWTIVSSSYVFTANGIQIPGSDFSDDNGAGQGPDTDKWRIRDKHLELGDFKYTIAVKPT